MKSDGVKDIFQWIDKKCREQKKAVEEAEKYYKQSVREWSYFEDTHCIVDNAEVELKLAQERLRAYVDIKIGVEKYMKKLKHMGE